MFARGSYGDADHRGTDLEANSASDADTNFRSDEAAGSRANVSAKPVSYNTTYRATVVSANWPTDRGADASTFSSTYIVTDCPSDRGADASTFGAANCATDIGTNRGADSITFSAAKCAADGVSDGEAFAITLGAADDSFSNSETFAATLIATDGAADSVSDGEAFRGADDGAHRNAVAAADYFTANHITTTYSDSDHGYAYDVNSDVCSHRLAVISTRATPYGGAL